MAAIDSTCSQKIDSPLPFFRQDLGTRSDQFFQKRTECRYSWAQKLEQVNWYRIAFFFEINPRDESQGNTVGDGSCQVERRMRGIRCQRECPILNMSPSRLHV